MSVRLIILGLLRDQELHGYELKKILEEQMGDWASVAVGSIYFALDKLAEEGLIEDCEAKQEGNRPAKTVYRITKAGRAEFLRLLRETWAANERPAYALDAGLAFMDAIPQDEIAGYLRARARELEAKIGGLEKHEAATMVSPDIPEAARWIFSHHLAHYRAELEWSRGVLAEME